ncbi:MAG: DUF362 domain-containing protein [Elusimicrobia bacterium]|nr:DUF362 domain-containing protein [Elusimicrobiota bacterium]
MTKSPVFFAPVTPQAPLEELCEALARLLDKSRLLDRLPSSGRIAVKMHFGEEGNAGFVRPDLVRLAADRLAARGAEPFLCDTNTLYKGRRTRCEEHLVLAREHGFTLERAGAEPVVPDDSKPENVIEVRPGGRWIQTAKLARVFAQAQGLLGIAHFKGHLVTGFGGALKNLGMGCASREGKLAQHSTASPIVDPKACTACGACVEACPAGAIRLEGEAALLDRGRCSGCASCLAACPFGALDVDWASGGRTLQEKMAEYAKAALDLQKGRCAFLNFCVKITAECDCLANDEARIAPDVGILGSEDPVAADQACLDLALKAAGSDVFQAAHPGRDGSRQLAHAESLGLGWRGYDLLRV